MGKRINRLMSTMNESSDAVLEMADMGNERAYKWGKIVLEEARRTQREQADLTRTWLEAPVDAIGFTKAAIDTRTRRTPPRRRPAMRAAATADKRPSMYRLRFSK